jgi:hypothetical protein
MMAQKTHVKLKAQRFSLGTRLRSREERNRYALSSCLSDRCSMLPMRFPLLNELGQTKARQPCNWLPGI